jgi:hypothetical protein
MRSERGAKRRMTTMASSTRDAKRARRKAPHDDHGEQHPRREASAAR